MNAAVTGCTADFTIGTAALMKGLQRHHPGVRRIVFTLPDQVHAVSAKLGDLAEVRPIPGRLTHAPADPKLLASWARVFVASIDADAVAWFDSDVIFCAEAPQWWQVPPGKINAVADRAYRIRHMVPHGFEPWYFQRFPINPDANGFNAGIFSLRPQDHPNLANDFDALLAECDANRIPFAMDQGLLNGLFAGRVNWLPPEYNAHCLAECGVPRHVQCIHYTGSPKPWADGYDRASVGYYHWLADGEAIDDPARLRAVRRRIALAKPRRFAGKAIRKVLFKLGLHKPEMGVGKKPDSP